MSGAGDPATPTRFDADTDTIKPSSPTGAVNIAMAAVAAAETESALCARIVALSEDAIISIDAQRRIKLFNLAAEHIFGYRADEIIGQPAEILMPARFRDDYARRLTLVGADTDATYGPVLDIGAGRSPEGDGDMVPMVAQRALIICTRRNGEEFPTEAAVSRVETPTGPVYSISLRDISERQRIERALKRSEASLAAAQRIAHLGSWTWDIGPNRLHWSDETFRIMGLVPGSVKPNHVMFMEAMHPDDRIVARESMRTTLKSLDPFSIDHRIIRPDGEVRHIHLQGRVTVADDSAIRQIAGTIQDVTARKLDEAKLGELNQRLADKNRELDIALENTQHGLALYDSARRLTLWNQHYPKLYRLPPASLKVGMPLAEVIEAAEIANGLPMALAAEVMRQRLELADSAERQNFLQYLSDGTVIDGLHLPLPDGRLIATLTDVTERERRESELTQAKEAAEAGSRAKSEFLATMSHELRTPLNAIIGFAEMLVGEVIGPLAPRYHSYAEDIAASGQHLLAIINAILDMSKIEAGKFQLSESEFLLAGAVQRSVRVLAGRAKEAGLSLHADIPRALMLCADERIVSQILLNLISNAVKFTPSGGEVRIAAQLQTDGLLLSVQDSGIGIAQEDIPKSLQPFGQIDSSLSRKYAGTGLGLPLVKSLIELHGGKLIIDSEVGFGTTVTALFPRQRCRISTDSRPNEQTFGG